MLCGFLFEKYIHWANQQRVPLEPNIKSEEEQKLLDEFKASFTSMENNSSRRSSDAEHQLIKKLMQCYLHRQPFTDTF